MLLLFYNRLTSFTCLCLCVCGSATTRKNTQINFQVAVFCLSDPIRGKRKQINKRRAKTFRTLLHPKLPSISPSPSFSVFVLRQYTKSFLLQKLELRSFLLPSLLLVTLRQVRKKRSCANGNRDQKCHSNIANVRVWFRECIDQKRCSVDNVRTTRHENRV